MVRKKRGRGQSTPASSGRGKIRGTTSTTRTGRSPAPTGRGESHVATSRGRSRPATRRDSASPSPSPSPSPVVKDEKSPAASSEQISPSPTPPPPAAVSEEKSATTPATSTEKPEYSPATSREKEAGRPSTISRPARPGFCSDGHEVEIRTNHFKLEFTDLSIYKYNVTIETGINSTTTLFRKLKLEIIKKFKAELRNFLGGKSLACDVHNNCIYTSGLLPFDSKKFFISLDGSVFISLDGSEDSAKGPEMFSVTIKKIGCLDFLPLKSYLDGEHSKIPDKEIQIFNTLLKESAFKNSNNLESGGSLYSPCIAPQPFDNGIEIWRGYFRSVRPTQMGLTVNLDVTSAVFIESVPVIDFVMKILKREDTDKELSRMERDQVTRALVGIQIFVTHRKDMRSRYRISGITPETSGNLRFPDMKKDTEGAKTMISIFSYYKEKYNYAIQHLSWPCLQVGKLDRPTFLPMEVCTIVKGQKYSHKLNKNQSKNLEEAGRVSPQMREEYIKEMAKENARYDNPYLRGFGLNISDNLTLVEAHILPPPVLKYSGKDCTTPSLGYWDMHEKKLIVAKEIEKYMCINLAHNITQSEALDFCKSLSLRCGDLGMVFPPSPLYKCFKLDEFNPSVKSVVNKLSLFRSYHKKILYKLRQQGKELQLLIAILPDQNNGIVYKELKKMCETDIGVVSQCCIASKVREKNPQFLLSLALKINAKLGGKNINIEKVLPNREEVSDVPTIIFGADVTHPHRERPGPSIAAVVASQDWPEVGTFTALSSIQGSNVEIIKELYIAPNTKQGTSHGGMVRELLCSFIDANGQKPQRIIFYRAGVGESQFNQVALLELNAIRRACESIESGYRPSITFIVAQKRHHTRFFPKNHNPNNEGQNISPGTLVDREICHPSEFDFFLSSHPSYKGTSRPTHYHVLCDENNFTANELQQLSNNLCYMFPCSTSAISIVSPVYYAHLAAYRARIYCDGNALKPVTKNLKQTMVYL